jgi:hypothetical protein
MAAYTRTVLLIHVVGELEHWQLIGRRRGDNQNQRTEVEVEVEAEAPRSQLTDYKIDKSRTRHHHVCVALV